MLVDEPPLDIELILVRRCHELELLGSVLIHLLLEEELPILGVILLLQLPLEVLLFVRQLLVHGAESALEINHFVLCLLLLFDCLRLLATQPFDVFPHLIHF